MERKRRHEEIMRRYWDKRKVKYISWKKNYFFLNTDNKRDAFVSLVLEIFNINREYFSY